MGKLTVLTYCQRCSKAVESEEHILNGSGTKIDHVILCDECEKDVKAKWEWFNQCSNLLKKENAGIAEITPDSASLAGTFDVDELQNIINFMKWWKSNV